MSRAFIGEDFLKVWTKYVSTLTQEVVTPEYISTGGIIQMNLCAGWIGTLRDESRRESQTIIGSWDGKAVQSRNGIKLKD